VNFSPLALIANLITPLQATMASQPLQNDRLLRAAKGQTSNDPSRSSSPADTPPQAYRWTDLPCG
jgi:hypothetical protein